MKTFISVCVAVAVSSTGLVFAGKQKSSNSGHAAHAAGGGGGAAGAMRGAGSGGGAHAMKGMGGTGHMNAGGQHNPGNNNFNRGAGNAGQHGLNAHSGRGLNGGHNNGVAGHSLNARNGIHNGQLGRANAHLANRGFAGNRFERHWRSGLHWRNSHALYLGYRRAWHDRWWWHSHYNHVVFIDGPYWGGHWYWDGGYWFPAWGYDPLFTAYIYDGPIYAYANLPPDQVVVNVQEALQDQGYYAGDVDGQLGSKTRDALAAYQRDHGLEVTAGIDEPTVGALGLS